MGSHCLIGTEYLCKMIKTKSSRNRWLQNTEFYLMPLNCTLKMVKIIKFAVCIFYCNKKLQAKKGEMTKRNFFFHLFLLVGG